MPTIKSQHAIISDACRAKGDMEAFEEAVDHLRQNYQSLLKHWERGKGAKFHVKLEVEYD